MRHVLDRNRTFIKAVLLVLALLPLFAVQWAQAQGPVEGIPIEVHVFMRDDCTFCQAEKDFLAQLQTRSDLRFNVVWHDVANDLNANYLYQQITKEKEIPRITPITVIGTELIQGFDTPETTGKRIEEAIRRADLHERIAIGDFVTSEVTISGSSTAGCESGDLCTIEDTHTSEFLFTLPFVGVVDVQKLSLVTLSVVLGLVDGFNPCAMWVLVTFLLILLQIGDRRRMFQVAGLFILAEAIMYWLILNVWYTAWDFVGLDAIVTPLVGLLAIGGGLFFLYRYYKTPPGVCDVSDVVQQGKIQSKIQALAKAPLTLAAIGGIIAIAFSVNVIEFACSVGIPQAFTKILELNQLGFWGTQWYTGIYILFYMIDDFIVFAIALWGFDKLHASQKYTRLSLLIGGVLMVILGLLLTFAPTLLTFNF